MLNCMFLQCVFVQSTMGEEAGNLELMVLQDKKKSLE